MAKAPTSYIATAGAARTRTTDSLTFPLATRPQAMTIYLRFIEAVGVSATGSGILIGTGPDYLQVYRSSGYLVTHDGSVSSTLSTLPSVGDLVELCVQLLATGSVQIHQSINGGTVTSATASASHAMSPSWSLAKVTLGPGASGSAQIEDTTIIRDVFIVRGVHSLAAMRVRMGLTP